MLIAEYPDECDEEMREVEEWGGGGGGEKESEGVKRGKKGERVVRGVWTSGRVGKG